VTSFVDDQYYLVNKPLNWTSFDVVNKLRSAFKLKKVGHAGTLDPLATGLLILCTGKMTKQIDSFQSLEKEYEGKFIIGSTSPSYDLETLPTKPVSIENVTEEHIYNTAKSFLGIIKQIPPPYSSIKLKGKRAYELARKGEQFELKSREVEIKKFEIVKIAKPEIQFRVVCTKGTYIRSLAHDFGQKLNTGALLSELCRTRIGEYRLENAKTVEEILK